MNWKTKRLADLITLERGFDLPKSSRIPGKVPVISAGKEEGTHNKARVKGPGFAIGRITNLGRPRWSDIDYWPLNTTLYAKDFHGNNPRWLYYLFKIMDLSGYDSGSVQPALNRNYISEIPVQVPSIKEQDSIVSCISALDDKIAVNNKIIKIISELLKKYWRYLCNNSSEWVELGNIITFNPQTSKPSKNACPFLEMKNLPEHGLNAQNWEIKERRSGTKFMNGDVLLARITPCFENGKIGIVDFLKEGEVGMGSTEYIVMRTKSALPPAAIYCIATSSEFRSYAAQSMTGSSGRQRVQVAPLQKFKVPNLKPTTLKEFNSFSQSLLAISKIHRDENQVLARTRDELLPLLMSGKITVRDAEEASAEVGVDKHEVEE